MVLFKIIERKGRLEMGWKLLSVSGASGGFLGGGVRGASLGGGGTRPVNREEFITEMIRGKSVGRQVMARVEGMGSRMQVEVFMPESMAVRSARQ